MITEKAEFIQTGPIDGGFGASAALYSLSRPVTYNGKHYSQLIVSAIDADETGDASTIALPYGDQGFAYDFDLGLFYRRDGVKLSHGEVLRSLGYELATAPAEL